MTASPDSGSKGARHQIKPGHFLWWNHERYQIAAVDWDRFEARLTNIESNAEESVRIDQLFSPENQNQTAVFARTLDELDRKVTSVEPPPSIVSDIDMPEGARLSARNIVQVVETVEGLVKEEERRANARKEKFYQTRAVERILRQLDNPICLKTYYNYRKLYKKFQGNPTRIAASMRRSTFHRPRMSAAQLHLFDRVILRYSRIYTPSELLDKIRSILRYTGGLWIDPDRCGDGIPESLVDELFEGKIPIQAILDNPEKKQLLVPTKPPSRGWFFGYLRWFKAHPDGGRTFITERYGEEIWEAEYMTFDSFVAKASLPLQYVFADHYLLDVFVVDEETRSNLSRLWLTVLIDAYSRCVVGMALLYEQPCIESVQSALRHAIWPKTSHRELGIDKEWVCCGIPQQLSLDNAWGHHSHSLEEMAGLISQGGKFNSIDLAFRVPYKARQGALIERFFGNLAAKIKMKLPGAIAHSDTKHVHNAAKEACLIYEDVNEFIHRMIVDYHHRPHSELKGMTPHAKWREGMQSVIPEIPKISSEVERYFWRKHPDTRVITRKGISLFNLTYWSSEMAGIETRAMDGTNVAFSIRYEPGDISRIAVFRDGHWLFDAYAKEFRLQDGTYKSVSLWEWEMAKDLAPSRATPNDDWLNYIEQLDDKARTRRNEKKKTNRKQRQDINKRPPSGNDVRKTEDALDTMDGALAAQHYHDLFSDVDDT